MKKRRQKRSPKRLQPISNVIKRKRIIACFILLLGTVGLFNALKFGGASLDYLSVKSIIASWQNNAAIGSQEEFDEVNASITNAQMLHGSHPLYAELAGQLQEWGAVSGYADSDALHLAKEHYLATTRLRPLWPVTWANLAMVKWRLNEFDEEMMSFLNKADELGPYTKEVNVLFTRLGISLYQANHPMYSDIKETVHERIRKGLQNEQARKEILDFIDSTQSLEAVCRWISVLDDYTAEQHLLCV
jgi:hypothetical protein